ncbi:ATP-dependent DNA helicase RecG [Sinomonas atrocyanea]|uniref:Probable DNA 3'-5' helicase RecG n=1 Tax=Sinomonas atrocyanea TaxID=37927 RepID=A0A127A2R0_9MICC|nr:ATP-dependent DNA helicase RecG [Sinomonas atrocyanea]AMM33084.1 ATP-dependent DNA helicase RecG [Sinomonas atrocyanea]GEB65367.1 ATP-dependent DNA helicase RecG [Sinomonas atrocyanea]GGG73416.1 ATP-dependent DNA helicase RecG [Sinomonas atrocyanea]
MATERDRDLTRLVGGASAKKLKDHLGLVTAGDLLDYFPRRYAERGELTSIAGLPLDSDVTLLARVVKATSRKMATRKGTITDVVVTDGAEGALDTISLTFFNSFAASRQLRPGTVAMFSGRVGSYRGRLQLTNPDYVLLDAEAEDGASAEELAGKPIPVYPATAKLPSWRIAQAVATVLGQVDLEGLEDPIPQRLRAEYRLPGIADAYRMIHVPATAEEWAAARRRFQYEEALVLQTALARRKAQHAQLPSRPSPARRGGLLDAFDAGLPFTLTEGQREVGEVLAHELAAGHPMNRLLQGEVGSGKTVVALRAMLQVVDDGGQAALLAPTEVLAAQHYESIRRTLGPLARDGILGAADGVEVVLLTGSQSGAERKRSLLAAASGEAGIVVGTHALLSEQVQFADLGLVVVDEQHRFGVEQRDALRAKSLATPHLLVMTATPIPRTVAMTVFGDLETSMLRELPAGRAPIATHVVGLAENPSWERRIWARAREEIDAGRQVYIVCPTIGESGDDEGDLEALDEASWGGTALGPSDEPSPAASVAATLEQLAGESALAGTRIAALHGRLDGAQKASAMEGFAAGTTDLLVATTVIEVGVDVPNATLMVILDADRFGIAQLHQLRGRVGRGGHAGTCLLVTSLEPGHPSRERLDAVAASTDGFVLAQKDLEHRREGDILGASQSGRRSTLRLLRVLRDADVIERARADALGIVAEDPGLEAHPALKTAIDAYLEPEKEVFLERG